MLHKSDIAGINEIIANIEKEVAAIQTNLSSGPFNHHFPKREKGSLNDLRY